MYLKFILERNLGERLDVTTLWCNVLKYRLLVPLFDFIPCLCICSVCRSFLTFTRLLNIPPLTLIAAYLRSSKIDGELKDKNTLGPTPGTRLR